MSETSELESAAGRILIGGFEGKLLPEETARLIRSGALGGIILFTRNLGTLEETHGLVSRLHELSPEEPLWMAVDQEGGRVQRLRSPFPELPPMRDLAQVEQGQWVERSAELLARSLRVLGFTQDYAPVLDVDTNPDNPVIGDRSFSRDPHVVAELGARFIRTMQAHGIAACGKHFPGHGDTNQDSHFELPRLEHDLARLEAVELVPFRAAVEAEVASIMTAHVLFPALDPDHPATLSEKIVTPLLRDRLGYRGVIVSDDLEMKAVADHYGIEDSVVRAVRAGCDQLLICHTHELQVRAKEALIHAVEDGRLERSRLLEASGRVLEMKRKYPARMVAPGTDVVASFPAALHAELQAAVLA